MAQPAPRNALKQWQEIVQKSGGKCLFLPDAFKNEWESLESTRKAYNEELVKMADKEIHMNVAVQAFWLKVREYLAKNGLPDIWVKNIGANETALLDGLCIVNISENQR